jgi:hypothetical protein
VLHSRELEPKRAAAAVAEVDLSENMVLRVDPLALPDNSEVAVDAAVTLLVRRRKPRKHGLLNLEIGALGAVGLVLASNHVLDGSRTPEIKDFDVGVVHGGVNALALSGEVALPRLSELPQHRVVQRAAGRNKPERGDHKKG